jgi:mediator of RNA polymerase II transcription subunit 7
VTSEKDRKMDDTDAAIAAEQQQVKNPFPTPPPYWTRYTPENLRLLGLLQTRLKENKEIRIIEEEESSITEGDEDVDQAAILADEESLPPFSLLELEPPRLDWILEQETYSSFGEIYLVCSPPNDITASSALSDLFTVHVDERRGANISPGCEKAL